MDRSQSSNPSASVGDGQGSFVLSNGSRIDWERAQKRMLLYLGSLNVAPGRSLALAVQAYEQARARADVSAEPVAEVMISLWEVLKRHDIISASGIDFNARVWRNRAYRCSGNPVLST